MNMKRIILYALMMMFMSPVAGAMGDETYYDFEYEGLRYIVYDTTAMLTNGSLVYSGYLVLPCPNLVIPSRVPYEGKEYTVIAIDNVTFKNNSTLESILLPQTLRTIGHHAFEGTGLTGVVLPDSLESIGEFAFSCSSLQGSLTLPESLKSLGIGAFMGYNGITSVQYNCIDCKYNRIINGSSITYGALPYSTTDLVFGEKVKCIPSYLAEGCKMITNLTIPESMDSIAYNAFDYDCNMLKNLTFNAVNLRRRHSFPSTRNIEKLTIGENVEYLPPLNGSKITSLVIPNKVKTISPGAFAGSELLSEVKLGNSVDTIGEIAFLECISLTSISIPSSVRFIGSECFKRCKALDSIIVEPGNTVYDSREGCKAIIETVTNTLISGCNNSFIPNTIYWKEHKL